MKEPRSAWEELTDPANERILGTLTNRAWRKMARVMARAQYYDTPVPVDVLHTALQMSGSIGGDHRKDLVEAVRGAPRIVGAMSDDGAMEVGRGL